MKLRFENTGIACPEQYDVWYKTEKIGYVRERHDFMRADYKGVTVFEKTAIFGDFKDNTDRILLLSKIAKILIKHYLIDIYGKLIGTLIFPFIKVRFNKNEIISLFNNLKFEIPNILIKPITYKDIINRIVKTPFGYDEEHKPTQEMLEGQKEILKQVIDFYSLSETEKENTGTWLYLIYCYNEHYFRIIEKQVDPKDVFLDEIMIEIPKGSKEDMARSIEKQVSILQSLRKEQRKNYVRN